MQPTYKCYKTLDVDYELRSICCNLNQIFTKQFEDLYIDVYALVRLDFRLLEKTGILVAKLHFLRHFHAIALHEFPFLSNI